MRPIEAQDVADFERCKHLFGKESARHATYVQLKTAIGTWRIGQREGSAFAALEQDIDVLPRLISKAGRFGQRQHHPHHVGRQPFELFDARGQRLDRDHLA